jgi:opine dehydrogenase
LKIGVLGSGAGGTAVAFDWSAHGHDVFLFDFPRFPDNVARIAESGVIKAAGDLEGSAPIEYAGHEMETVVSGADVVFVVGPAFAIRPFAAACAPFLEIGQEVVVCPGSTGGALAFKNEAGLDVASDEIRVSETSTLPYAVRLTEPGRIRVFLKLTGGFFVAALPARYTDHTLAMLREVYPGLEPASNILQTTLQNANPVIHPVVTLLNAARIEGTGGDFLFYEEGVTPAVGRLIQAVDQERIAIGKALGVEVEPDPELSLRQGYMTDSSYEEGYRTAPGFQGIKAQSGLDHRYLNEDVGYGLVFLSELGRQLGVPTPIMDSVIALNSRLMNRDYRARGPHTPASLGIAGLNARELVDLVS